MRKLLIPNLRPRLLLPRFLILRLMTFAHVNDTLSDPPRNSTIILGWGYESDLSGLDVQYFGEILKTAMITDSVKGVLDLVFTARGCLHRGLELLDEGRIADAVIENDVPLGFVNERLHVRNTPAGDTDQGVNVRLDG